MLTPLLLFTLHAIVAAAQDSPQNNFRCDYTYVAAAGYYFKLHRVPVDWDTARLQCQLEGATLASPLRPALRLALQGVAAGLDSVFTGIHATFASGVYYSMEGIPLSAIEHQWAAGEPGNLGDRERCLRLDGAGRLADAPCAAPRPFVCYRERRGTDALNDCGTVDDEYQLNAVTGSCYKFHRAPRPWGGGFRACAAEGAHLAVINSEREARELSRLFQSVPAADLLGNFWKDVAFVGFHGWNENGDWRTVHDQSLVQAGYAAFAAGEPNNMTGGDDATRGECCGALHRAGRLHDVSCARPLAFVCERRPAAACPTPSP